MKIGELRKLRNWCMSKRELSSKNHEMEPYGPMNLYRPRLAGRVEAYDAMISRIDGLMKQLHDRWHDGQSRRHR